MTPPDKITVTQAWLYEHDEFGRQVHGSRWGMANGGSFDDFVGWRETQLVCRRAATSDNLALMREAMRSLDGLLAEYGNLAWLSSQAEGPGAAQAKLTLAKLRDEIARGEG